MSTVSARKRAANRRNAKLSTGPKTEEGKARSSRNATTHGIFARDLILPGEDAMEFNAFRSGMLKRLNPRDELEMHFAEQIASCSWRIRRIRSAEWMVYVRHANSEMRREYTPHDELIDGLLRHLEKSEEQKKDDPEFKEMMSELRQCKRPLDQPLPMPSAGAMLADLMHQSHGGATPDLERLTLYETRLQNNLNRALSELRKLKKEFADTEPNEFTEALIAQNEATETEDDANDSNDEELETDEENENEAMSVTGAPPVPATNDNGRFESSMSAQTG